MTKQRAVVLEVIQNSCEHMTAEQIYLEAKKKIPSIAVGTVYRNLGLLTDTAKIRKIQICDAPDRYDKNVYPHEHLICDSCGMLSDIDVDGLVEDIENKIGTKVISYELSIHYICSNCRKHINQ